MTQRITKKDTSLTRNHVTASKSAMGIGRNFVGMLV
jgi:hypothetical protein